MGYGVKRPTQIKEDEKFNSTRICCREVIGDFYVWFQCYGGVETRLELSIQVVIG